MSDRTQKILFAVVFILLSIGIGVGLYIFFFKPLVSPTPTLPTPQTPTGQLPQAGTGGTRPQQGSQGTGTLTPSAPSPFLPGTTTPQPPSDVTLLRDGVTQAVSRSTDGQGARFYNPDDGRFYRLNPDGTITALGEKQFFNVSNVSWANTTDQAILKFPDQSAVFYDFESRRQTTLPSHWQDFTFAPDDSRIAAKSLGLDPGSRFLVISKPDGNEAKALEQLGQNASKVQLSWSPSSQAVGFSQTGRPQGEGGEEIYLIGQNHENFKSLIVPGRGFMPNWSPNGNIILYSVYHERDELRPSLWVSGGSGDSIGEGRRAIRLNTWASKCAWRNEDEVICGVPQSLEIGAGLAPDRFASVPDDVYQVNLKTGVSTKISTADQTHPIRQPVISADKSKLIFTDAVTGRLYSYRLP